MKEYIKGWKMRHVIDKPHLLKFYRRVAESVFTIVGTGIVAYVVFLATLAIWYFAGFYMVEKMFSWRHIEDTTNMLMQLSFVALVSVMVFLFWGEYNFRMFANRERRNDPPPVLTPHIAKLFDTTEEAVLAAQESKFMLFHVSEGNHVLCDLDNQCINLRSFNHAADQ